MAGRITKNELSDNLKIEIENKASQNDVNTLQDGVNSHWAEDATDAHNAGNISVIDTEGHFTATDVEGALSELFTSVSDGKTVVAAAITDKGISASGSDTFSQLAGKIGQINTGKKWASGNGTGIATTFTVTGLDFTPTIVLIDWRYDSASSNIYRQTNISALFNNEYMKYYYMRYAGAGSQMATGAEITISSGGFTGTCINGYPYQWIAIE